MSKQKSGRDPHADREAEKYENPIPSREYILDVLAKVGKPQVWQAVAELLDLHEESALDALQRRLRAMERDGQLIRNRRKGYGLVAKMDLVRGKVIAHPDGFGFLETDDGGDDLFLSARQMRQLMHNDRVLACISGIDRRGRREGSIVEVLERRTHQVVGRYFADSGIAYVAPDNKRITHDILVPAENSGGAQDSQIVVVEIVEQPSQRRQPIGRVVEVLGQHMAPGMEIDVAIRAHELPFQWNRAVEDEAAQFSTEVPKDALQDRTDLRDTPLVTIDGADARDFDDAVFCEKDGRDWRLIVAIADVAHYVRPGSALDQSAIERGNSVYFPGRVIPMLPEVLSNGLCSIRPEVERLCLACEMRISSAGQVKDYKFFNAVMRSHARLIYDDVAALLDGDTALRDKYSALVPHLENLKQLYTVLLKQRALRGAIDFETTETVIRFGKEKKIDAIVPLQRNDAHRMIEEFMIAANVSAARFLTENEMPTLYRIHDQPKTEKITDLRAFLSELGLNMTGGKQPQAKDYAQLLASVSTRPDWHLIQTVMLRSLNQAVYSPDNLGHFGLSLEEYAHFTSPIRRYPDLLVHRAIKHVLRGGQARKFAYGVSEMTAFGENCSMTERRADEATRDVVDWLKCEYMMDKVGETFPGIITSVTSFGLFVELKDIYVEGLVHVTSLRNDYYHFDPIKHSLVGERSRMVYRLGDTVAVQVLRVDLDDKKIDFDIVDAGQAPEKGPADKSSRKRGRSKSSKKNTAAKKNKGGATTHTPQKTTGKKTAKSKKAKSASRKRPGKNTRRKAVDKSQ